ncbi:hypothetical protein [Campylobacter ureolyticus]|uniref:Tetratricopeptide repeat-like domain-containing protein n=1 Tax=Campylobacter ureolyticus TaxID=827 RepID=A0AAE7EB50_9BACT|nr:hypothetical protein [Campylobacter ureolyticus]MCR8685070.1 hypothetical protein [Campylobacter ureolyticus]QKF84963.1 hypothetical protein CURT_1518 [Campylobacter ureolyticus]QQY34872.1 hypothetical protein I6I59_04860 [Campylobacter ureolyticus]SUX20378.1 Uncharacterized protein conserved in bacteria [Campylobacter ureolyticus]
MAIKDDIKDVKERMDSQGQFLENIIKSELFIKKYKKPIVGTFIVVFLAIVVYLVVDYQKEAKFKKANESYNELILNPNDKEAAKKLQSLDKNLFTLFEFRQALDNNDSKKIDELSNLEDIDKLLKDIISYEAGKQSGEILSSYSAFMSGYAYLKEGKVEEANKEFIKISPNSGLTQIVKNLRHYNGNKNEKN